MIARIRRGNDFHVAWRIKRGGVAENLENVTDIKLERTIYGVTTEHTLFTVSGDTITAEIPAEVQTHYGQYKLTLSYELVDTGMSDDDRKCKVAIYAFAIVDPLGPADDLLTVDVASDVSIGFKGDEGLSAYQVWLENGNVGTEDDYFDYLRQPATDAAASISALEQTISDNEALRVTAEQGRVDAELLRVGAESARSDAEGIRDSAEDDRIAAEGIRNTNETGRINAESDRVDAEDLREQAEVAREEAEGLRQTNTTTAIQDANDAATAANTAAGNANDAATAANTAAGNANDAATAANTAAGLADTARTELTTAVNTKLDEADGKISEMNTTLSTYDGRVTQAESDITQLAGEVSLLDAVQGAKIKDIENVLSSANLGQSTQVSVSGASPLSLPKNAANSGMSVKMEGLTQDVGGVITHFEPTGRVRSVDKNGINPTALYLTAPELRSNGLVKDEIRKGANGYELVKRVGVGTSNGEIVINGGFSTADNWTITGGESIISDGTLKIVADAGVGSSATQNKTITAGKIYRYSINVLGITGTLYLFFGSNIVKSINAASGIGVYTGFFITSANATSIRLVKELGTATNAEIDNLSIIEYNPAEGVAMAGGEAVFGSSVHYTLANPVVSPINYGGVLNSAENGTVYHEPVIADAGVYGTDIPIFNTDYPIASLEEIIKHENGVDTYLDVSTAVIAGDKLSFTHPSLQSGDLVLFTYAFAKETTNGSITATFYDSNVVKIDTVTGKAYKITDVVTNGVLTRTLTEV